jgi:uncharacterized protein (DUF2235 family)
MARASRNLIVLSDGTGNSAAKAFKTNVWRLYQALNLSDGSQVAVFGDGVGNSSISFLRILGLALGIGVKRNVLNLYKFLCHNYWRDKDYSPDKDKNDLSKRDRIWMFGFSRGAYTIRVLAGLVHSQGLVQFETEADLDRNALAAYRAFRADAFPPKSPLVFWVPLGRAIRDYAVSWWQSITGGTPYKDVQKGNRKDIEIDFVGVWDTVAAYGLPIDELSIAVDRWVWPMNFQDTSLLDCVHTARHALALDDERRTFHPIPWNEPNKGTVNSDRLVQAWFPGMHADVGGGYPDDGLSLVPLCWMIDEAGKKGLKFEKVIVDEFRALASPTGRMYDSRGGIVGGLWRYQPRNVQFLMDKKHHVPLPKRVTPLVHHCVVTRMTYGNDGYAPKGLPFKIDVLLPNNERVAFDSAAADAALLKPTDDATKRVLLDLKTLIDTASKRYDRGALFSLVLDSIWWRRLVYFVTLGLALVALVFPLIYSALDWGDPTAKINQVEGGTVSSLLHLFKGMIPSYASPWVDAVSASPQVAVNVVLLFIISLVVSGFLRRRILDRARASWNVQPKVGGTDIERLRLAGRRHALLAATIVLVIVAASAFLSGAPWVAWPAAVVAVVCAALFLSQGNKPKEIDPAHPPILLATARYLRNSPIAVGIYRWIAQSALPALFILAVAWVALSGINLGLYNLRSTNGDFCDSDPRPPNQTKADRKQLAETEKLGSADIDIKSPCARTHLWLVAGRQYRIQIEPGKGADAWFDRGTPADVTGLAANSGAHSAAIMLKRWWRERYFQPIARIGDIGNYEYPLHPASPLPKVDFSACGTIDVVGPPEKAAEEPDRLKFLQCEKDAKINRNEVLISDITPDSTGELYIYVNDAVLFWDSKDHHRFYLNNNGKAKVTVTRTLAPAMVDHKAP